MRCGHEAHGDPKIWVGHVKWPMRRSGAPERAVGTSCSARNSANDDMLLLVCLSAPVCLLRFEPRDSEGAVCVRAEVQHRRLVWPWSCIREFWGCCLRVVKDSVAFK